MGEMSEYFEDCPEQNPANYVGDRYDPAAADKKRDAKAKAVQAQADLDMEIARIIEKHSGPRP